jgi:RNA polymerase sigma factor (sigma-70 family)
MRPGGEVAIGWNGEVLSALAVATRPTDQRTEDLDLVEAVRAGDDRAFELLFLRYQGPISTYVRRMVRDRGRAEDITQEVFIAALRRMRETDREINFRPWIYEIAKNACIDAFRRGRVTNEVSFDADDALGMSEQGRLAACGAAPETVIDTKLALDNLCGALGGLSQTHHDILVMREFEGLSYREIGDRLGLSQAAVESTLFRARRRLSEEYEELISGERCVLVRSLVSAPPERAIGLRDRRRMARHLAHCQPCRRYAHRAGTDLEDVRRSSIGGRIAALLPLPAVLRRRIDTDVTPIASVHAGPATQWTASMSTLDPATLSGWSKAVATAATVAVASLGAGAAVEGPDAVVDFVSKAPAAVGLAPDRPAAAAAPARAPKRWTPLPADAGRLPTAPDAAAGDRGASTTGTDGAPTGATAPGAPDTGGAAGALPGGSAVPSIDAAPVLPGASVPDVPLPRGDRPALRPRDGADAGGPIRRLLDGGANQSVTTSGPQTGLPGVAGGVVAGLQDAVGAVTSGGSGAGAVAGDAAGEDTAAAVDATTSDTSPTPVRDALATVAGALSGSSAEGT